MRFGSPRKEEPNDPAAVDRARSEKGEGVGMMAGHQGVDLRIEMRIATGDRFGL
jgi:hypothetical protein